MTVRELINNPVLSLLLHVGLAILVILIGRRLAIWGRRAVYQALVRSKITESLVRFGSVSTYYLILVSAVILALAIMGVPLTGLLAVIGIVAILLGIALQDSISSIAATIQFLLFQPFQAGDLVETAGVMGIVKEIQFFNTVIVTYQKKTITIPNNKVRDSNIINYSEIGVLRADVSVSVGYEDDLRQVKKVAPEFEEDDL